MTPSQIAMVCHEANRAYCATQGDLSHAPWDQAPQSLKDSVVSGVLSLMADPSLSPQDLHKLWRGRRISEGWTYGKVKDFEKKTHPNLVTFEELPPQEQVKDYLFHSIVTVLSHLPRGYVHT